MLSLDEGLGVITTHSSFDRLRSPSMFRRWNPQLSECGLNRTS